MELKELTPGQVEEIYREHMVEDFPAAELPPLSVFLQRLERGFYECLGLYEDKVLKAYGYFTVDRASGYCLLDFLAVCPEYRSGGYGSHFLTLVREHYREKKGILLECEAERAAQNEAERSIRHRRLAFYQRNGCRVTCTKSRLFGVEFDILYLPLMETGPQADVRMRELYRLMLGEEGRRTHTTVWNRSRRIARVEAWNPETGERQAVKSLTDALGFAEKDKMPRIVSLVGAGGKTATMYQLADELAEQGCRVLVATSTHIRRPERGNVAVVSQMSEVVRELWDGPILTVGAAVPGDAGKLAMPKGLEEPEELERLLGFVDVILIEADGAKEQPLKVPEAWEPVILPQTGLVIACAGLGAVGQSFAKGCFRFAQKGGWLRRNPEDTITPEDVALILMDERGSHKSAGGRYYRIVLNQADGEEQCGYADAVWRALPATMQKGCAVTAYEQ